MLPEEILHHAAIGELRRDDVGSRILSAVPGAVWPMLAGLRIQCRI